MPRVTPAVRQYRRDAMDSLMDRLSVDALLFTTPDFFQYASNFILDVWPWERPVFLFVPRNGKPFALMNELSTHHLRMASESGGLWVDELNMYAEHPRHPKALPTVQQLPSVLVDLLRRYGLQSSRIACDGLPAAMRAVESALPQLQLQAVHHELRSLRWVKHPDELHIMRELGRLTDWAQERYRERYEPGVLTQAVDQEVGRLMVEEAARRFPGEDFEIMKCWTLSGPASASPHGDGRSSGARMKAGDTIVNFVLPRLNGYYVENERTWFCGRPNAQQVHCFETACRATDAGVAAARPGNRVCDIDAAALAVIEAAGLADHVLHRTGHAVGMMLHEYPEDMAFNTRALLPGEVYSSEPGIYVWGLGGFRQDDTVVVGDTPEVLVRTPKSLAFATVGV